MGADAEDPPRGTCPGMCPAREAELRRRQRRLHRLERAPSGRAVKEYSRPAAGKGRPPPEELRPPPVLLATVRYLLGEAARARPDVDAAEQCAFVADRLRAVRLDLALQRVAGRPCAAPLERALVYLLHAGARLGARLDAHLHRAHVQESFAALRRAYRHAAEEEEDEPEPEPRAPSEPRFHALFLLYNLGSPEALQQILQLPSCIRASPELSVALEIHWAYLERNFARFFRLARELPYLPSCALHQHLADARSVALQTFSHGFNTKNSRYPLGRLAQLLAVDSPEEAAELCGAHGLAVVDDSVVFQKASYKAPGLPEHRPNNLLVGQKWGGSCLLELSEAVCS